MTAAEIVKGRWYPKSAPALDGETAEQYTDRLTGADGTNRRPYDHSRNRQCSINYHDECSDRSNSGECGCPCHAERRDAEELAAAWNEVNPVGRSVSLPDCPEEPDVPTTGLAYVDGDGWPVVELDTFTRPVKLSWLKATP